MDDLASYLLPGVPASDVRRLAVAPPDDPELTHYQEVLWHNSTLLHALTFAPEIKDLMQRGGIQPGMRVLDAACGAGGKSRLLLEAGAAHVIGVDADPDELALARRLPTDARLELIDHDLYEPLPFPDASFDAVYCGDLPLPLYDEAVFASLRRVLRPHGLLLVESVNVLPDVRYGHDLALNSRVEAAFHAALADTAYGDGEPYAAAFHRMRAETKGRTLVVPAVRSAPFDTLFVEWMTQRFVCQFVPMLRPYLTLADFDALLALHDPLSPSYLFNRDDAFAVIYLSAFAVGNLS